MHKRPLCTILRQNFAHIMRQNLRGAATDFLNPAGACLKLGKGATRNDSIKNQTCSLTVLAFSLNVVTLLSLSWGLRLPPFNP